MSIQQLQGEIMNITDLSPTAKEVTIRTAVPLTFSAGAFVNVFIEDNGETVRRAFSISSQDGERDTFTLSIRHTPEGRLTPLFWNKNMVGESAKIMGPLGVNTANTMRGGKVYLFGFGIGVGVVKSLAEHFASREDTNQLTVMTGSRDDDDVMYRSVFEELQARNPRVETRHVVTSTPSKDGYRTGYIQDHINDFDFSNADVYICGQEVACKALQNAVEATVPENCKFYIEGFH